MSGATRRQDVMIRISGIFEFIDPNHLGFQESEVTLPQGEVGFQESGQEAGAAGTDCSNLHFHRPRCSPFFWNPAPLMQNYMIKSVKMTKKSILRDQFSWKVRTFAPAFRKGCRSFCCSISQPNCDLERDFYEQDLYIIGTAHHSAVSNHRCIGAVAGLSENMDGVCAFFMPIPIVLPPTRL